MKNIQRIFYNEIMFSGTLLGIANTLGNVGGFIAPTMAEAFTGFSVSDFLFIYLFYFLN